MGLDMYLTGETYFCNREDRRGTKKGELFHLGYWRKHPNLHGYIVQEFADGEDNCQPIELSPEQISQIIKAIESGQLPITTGFFFGESDGSEQPLDLVFFREALAWLNEAPAEEWRSVYYQASW